MKKKDIIDQLHKMGVDNGRELRDAAKAVGKQLEGILKRIEASSLERVIILGCGSSYFGALNVEHAFESLAGMPARGMEGFAFEAYQNMDLIGEDTLILGFTTSGETEALVHSLQRCRPKNAVTVAVTAVEDSGIARAAKEVLLTGAADETNVVRTKANTQALIAMYLMAIHLGRARGYLSHEKAEKHIAEIGLCIDGIVDVLDRVEPVIKDLTRKYAGCTACLILGSGPNTATAQTGALMTTEMAKIHSWGDELENFLHGRFREVNQTEPLLILAPDGAASRRTLDFLTVTDHVKGPTIVFTDKPTPGMKRLATHVVELKGGISEIMTPILYLTPLHLYAYHIAVANGEDPNVRRYPDIVPTLARYKGE
jgi:glucosamine--fructose-6-phosphate aminotransferase (isomerizing)